MMQTNLEIAEELYARANALYNRLYPTAHLCGVPGLPGPVGDSDEPWNVLKAHVESVIHTLQLILKADVL